MNLEEIMAENDNIVLSLTMDDHDPYDEFGWVQGWRFGMADFLHFEREEYVPEFRPASQPEFSYAYETLLYENPTTEDVQFALRVLDDYREWLGTQGRDY